VKGLAPDVIRSRFVGFALVLESKVHVFLCINVD
jgi:hypothetical protein